LADPARLKGFVADYASGESKAERLAFGRCIEYGGYTELKNAQDAGARQQAKAAIARKLHANEGLDITLCNDVLDTLEAAVFGEEKPKKALCLKCGKELEPGWVSCPYCGAGNAAQAVAQRPPQTAYSPPAGATGPKHQATPHTTPASPENSEKNTGILRNVLIVMLVIGIAVFAVITMKPAWLFPPKLNDYDQIIFTQKNNNDEFINENLTLTLKDVKAIQKFVTENYPGFDFKEAGYETDDYRNELLIKEFNNNPKVMHIYLKGIKEMAGKSSVYACLSDDGTGGLLGYFFSIDQEFSDTSGFEYFSGYYPSTYQYDGQINSITLYKYLYSDSNEPYWKINWDSDIPVENRLALLNNFLNRMRHTKVFKNFCFDFFKDDVFTGIEKNQRVKDIID
jgi:hypothetical protein